MDEKNVSTVSEGVILSPWRLGWTSFKRDKIGMAGALMAAVNRGYGPGWLDDFPLRVSALTQEQVNAAIRKYLKPDQMILIKAGTLP